MTSAQMLRGVALLAASITPIVAIACGSDGLLQGDEYLPDGRLPIAPASERPEAGGCEGGTCDAGEDVVPLPVPEGGTEPANTCETARDIGTIAADDGVPSLGATGSCSEWLRLRATEDDSGLIGKAMKLTFTLQPSGADFDLYAYLNPDRDQLSCAAPFKSSFMPGEANESIQLQWGEGSIPNGKEDARTVGIAILRKGSPCDPAAGSYRLTIEGNR